MSVEVGQKAPEFNLLDQDRTERKLADYRGKNVLLAFYPAAFTGGCTKEVCSLRDNMAELNNLNIDVLGISMDNPFSQKAWAEQHQLNFPLLADWERKAIEAYDVARRDFLGMTGFTAAQRSIFLVNKDGNVAYKWVATTDPIPPYEEIKAAVAAAS